VNLPYKIFPLGDSAITVDFGNLIDEAINDEVIIRAKQWQYDPLPGQIEIVPAYSSITVFYDLAQVKKSIPGSPAFESIKAAVEKRMLLPVSILEKEKRLVNIPVCYDPEFAPDLLRVLKEKKLSKEELVSLHSGKKYRVYMLGFLPGFPYMGEVDERLLVPRKKQPENVIAGSVGIAGKQTGVYTLDSPGGWQIIGKTPVKLFDTGKSDPVLLKAGDIVQFHPITADEYRRH